MRKLLIRGSGKKLKTTDITILVIFYIFVAKEFFESYCKKNIVGILGAEPRQRTTINGFYREATKADWNSPNEIKAQYVSASILKNSRVVFNICGNKYRLIVEINFPRKWVFIRFIGNHKE